MQDTKKRYIFIDILRGLAVLKMIEGHVVRALIKPEILFFQVNPVMVFLDGLTAPAFLFISGISFCIVIKRHKDDFLRLNKKFFSRLRKIFFIIFVGYWLHLPFFSLRKTLSSNEAILREFLKTDILQCIGVSLLILQILFLFLRRESVFNWTILVAGSLIIFLTPIIWNLELSFLPLGIKTYFSMKYGSPFPLFHWSSYILFGYLITHAFFHMSAKNKGKEYVIAISLLGLLLYLFGLKTHSLFARIYGSSFDFWYGSPNIFFIRLAMLFLLFSVLYLLERFLIPISKHFIILGIESLHAYWIHLVILFGSILPLPSIKKLIPHHLGFIETMVIFLGLSILVYYTSYLWKTLKERSHFTSKMLLRSAVIIFLIIFLIRKY